MYYDIKAILMIIVAVIIALSLYLGFKEIVRLKTNEIQYERTQQILVNNVETITASIALQEANIKQLQQKYNSIKQETVVLQKKMDSAVLESMGRKDQQQLRDYINKSLEELFKELSE